MRSVVQDSSARPRRKTLGFNVMKKNASNDGDPREGSMLRALVLGTVLLAGPLLSMAWTQNSWTQNSWAQNSSAQDKTEPTRTGPPFPFSKTTFRWDYSCPANIACSFTCPGGESSHVIKLSLYLGTVSFDGGQNTPAMFYEFVTREFPHASGFSISARLNNLSCQVNGMTLDYSGSPN